MEERKVLGNRTERILCIKDNGLIIKNMGLASNMWYEGLKSRNKEQARNKSVKPKVWKAKQNKQSNMTNKD